MDIKKLFRHMSMLNLVFLN